MSEDGELLRRYAVEHSDAAFAELVRRYLDLVYSAALRLVNGDAHRAQDVTQQVFAELARQARRLVRHPALVGWLYTTTRLIALRTIRTEQRRNVREQEANIMNELLRESTPELDWEHLSPMLEDAMHELGEKDRHAVLLRFFQNKSLKEVGAEFGPGRKCRADAGGPGVGKASRRVRAAGDCSHGDADDGDFQPMRCKLRRPGWRPRCTGTTLARRQSPAPRAA